MMDPNRTTDPISQAHSALNEAQGLARRVVMMVSNLVGAVPNSEQMAHGYSGSVLGELERHANEAAVAISGAHAALAQLAKMLPPEHEHEHEHESDSVAFISREDRR